MPCHMRLGSICEVDVPEEGCEDPSFTVPICGITEVNPPATDGTWAPGTEVSITYDGGTINTTCAGKRSGGWYFSSYPVSPTTCSAASTMQIEMVYNVYELGMERRRPWKACRGRLMIFMVRDGFYTSLVVARVSTWSHMVANDWKWSLKRPECQNLQEDTRNVLAVVEEAYGLQGALVEDVKAVKKRVDGDFGIQSVQRCENVLCPSLFDPACGTDGRTYDSLCELNRQRCVGEGRPDLFLSYMGRCGNRPPDPGSNPVEFCRNPICTLDVEEVCASSGMTFRNRCFLARARCFNPQLRESYQGRCRTPFRNDVLREHPNRTILPPAGGESDFEVDFDETEADDEESLAEGFLPEEVIPSPPSNSTAESPNEGTKTLH
ncbi:unnamed protein product [Cyprideis torosa]|uniref:Uncharacterized protein n=1 Tax=Cyprideis torosa TaxID=163714 RepID=A0A7R8WHA9_9CRUS|nr:unnamed protein product [Cyprideis torosa]CAG0896396.1 unnamed protein product [Cyprideis torosa]